MSGGSTMARWSWYTACSCWQFCSPIALFEPAIAAGQAAYEINPLGTDAGRRVDRYQITLGPGASLWDLGFNRLPMVAIEQGDQKVVELIEQSFRNEYPDRGPQLVKPGDSFVLEVPTGTFVSKTITRQAADRVLFESFAGDQLTTFPKDPIVQYRLRRASAPDQVEVLIQGGQADAVEEAKKIYDVPDPDFVQVRTVRGALAERTSKIKVDANRSYLDEFRAVRGRATLRRGHAPGPEGVLLQPRRCRHPVRAGGRQRRRSDRSGHLHADLSDRLLPRRHRAEVRHHRGRRLDRRARPARERDLAANAARPGRSGCPARPRRCRRSPRLSPARARSSLAASWCWRSARASRRLAAPTGDQRRAPASAAPACRSGWCCWAGCWPPGRDARQGAG